MIEDIALFAGLEEEAVEAVRDVSCVKFFPKNAIIISEGDGTSSLYIVLGGKAIAIAINEDGRQIVLNVFMPGDYFGEMSFIDGDTRSATIMTKEPCRFLVVPREGFERITKRYPEIMYCLLKGVLHKLRRATRQIQELAFMDVYGRISRFLTESQNENGIIGEALTHQDIAYVVGASREMVSRVMKELNDRGYIRKSNRRILILKKLPYKLEGN